MRVDDRLHDRQAEPEAVAPVAAAGGNRAASVEPGERLHELADLLARDDRAGVRDLQRRLAVTKSGPRGHPAVRVVVADRVLDQVRDEPLDHRRVARRGRVTELGVHLDPVRGHRAHDLGGHLAQVDRGTLLEPALAAGERQQRLDQALLLLARGEHAPARLAQRLDRRIGIAERHLDQRALERDRRPQLVRGVGDEPALGLERRLQAPEQPVEGVTEFLELVVGSFEREALMEVPLGYAAGPRAHRPDRPQRSSGHQPAEPDRRQRHDRQREPRPGEERVQL